MIRRPHAASNERASPANPIHGVTTNTLANINLRVPYLGFAPTGLLGTGYDLISNYNSLQVTLRKQFTHGLTMQAAYTWSKSLTNSSENSANYNNASDLAQQYGPSYFNRPHRFIVNYNYELPFGNRPGALGKLTSGWSVSGVTTIQDGQSLTIIDSNAGTIYGTSTGYTDSGIARAQMCPGKTYADIATPGDIKQRLGGSSGGPGYLNPKAFCPAPVIGDGTGFGNSGMGIILGPGQFNWDFSVLKNTKLGESRALQLRLAKSKTCVESAAQVGQSGTSRVVSLGDESLTALLTEELRIRSRDRAFESALAGVLAS